MFEELCYPITAIYSLFLVETGYLACFSKNGKSQNHSVFRSNFDDLENQIEKKTINLPYLVK